MSSSQRTYSRKRKDEAEEKFDALFSNKILRKPITIHVAQIKKPKKDNGEAPSIKLKNGAEAKFNSSQPVDKGLSPKKSIFSDALSFSPVKSQKAKTYVSSKTNDSLPFHSYKSIAKSKYDVLFKKNEKNASDKFDALFGDELMQTSQDTNKASVEIETIPINPEYENLFGFADSPAEDCKLENQVSPTKTVFDLEKIPSYSSQKSPIKLSGITGASMRTVGGKVVLNIQKRTKSPRKQSFEQSKTLNNSSKSTSGVAATKQNLQVEQKSDSFSSANDSVSLFGNHKKSVSFSDAAPMCKISKLANSFDDKLRNTKVSLHLTENVPAVQRRSSSVSPKKVMQQRKPLSHKSISKRPYSPLTQTSTSKPSYNSRPWMQKPDEKDIISDKDSLSQSQPDSYEFDLEEATPKLTRSVTWPEQIGDSIKTSLKCDKSVKAYFTVVKHVKNYQNCLEEGETKEFEDEVNYLLEGLQPSQPLSVRCLSVTNFASKCQQHNFRLYLRAHNIVDKVFSHLGDAKEHTALALSTAALLFMLSRDRQMEINKSTLQLLLRLLDPFDKDDPAAQKQETKKEKDTQSKYKFFKSKDKTNREVDSLKANSESVEKIKHLIATSGDHLFSEADVSVKRLSSEALLRFTARRTVEWYREEIRIKGGLDHIISLVKHHVDQLETLSKEQQRHKEDEFKPKTTLCILERLLKVLENAIINSPRNAMYLVTHQRALLLKKLAKMMQLTKSWLPVAPAESDEESTALNTYTVLRNSIVQIIKLLVNISNDNEWVSSRVGEQDGMLENIVECVLKTPSMLKEEHRYELILLSLSLLVNLVESSAKNRIALMKMTLKNLTSGLESDTLVINALVQLFEQREAAAKENEILGESGIKKAVAAKKINNDQETAASTSKMNTNDNDGHWVETEDGMEWVPSEKPDDVIGGSQDSSRSAMSNKNPESNLTAEEKNEMKETLDKANEHMEDSIVASYAALVLGCLIHGNRANSAAIRSHFSPDSGFSSMNRMLKKFLSFMSLTAGMSAKGEKTLTDIIEAVEEEMEYT